MVELPEEVVRDMLETLRVKLEKINEELVAETNTNLEAFRARLAAAEDEIERLRQLERIRHTYEAEQDDGSQLQ